MPKKELKSLEPILSNVLEKLKSFDTDELVKFYSVPPTNSNDRDRKMKGLLLLGEGLELIKFAQMLIK